MEDFLEAFILDSATGDSSNIFVEVFCNHLSAHQSGILCDIVEVFWLHSLSYGGVTHDDDVCW